MRLRSRIISETVDPVPKPKRKYVRKTQPSGLSLEQEGPVHYHACRRLNCPHESMATERELLSVGLQYRERETSSVSSRTNTQIKSEPEERESGPATPFHDYSNSSEILEYSVKSEPVDDSDERHERTTVPKTRKQGWPKIRNIKQEPPQMESDPTVSESGGSQLPDKSTQPLRQFNRMASSGANERVRKWERIEVSPYEETPRSFGRREGTRGRRSRSRSRSPRPNWSRRSSFRSCSRSRRSRSRSPRPNWSRRSRFRSRSPRFNRSRRSRSRSPRPNQSRSPPISGPQIPERRVPPLNSRDPRLYLKYPSIMSPHLPVEGLGTPTPPNVLPLWNPPQSSPDGQETQPPSLVADITHPDTINRNRSQSISYIRVYP